MNRQCLVWIGFTGVVIAGALGAHFYARERSLSGAIGVIEKEQADVMAMQQRFSGVSRSAPRTVGETYVLLVNGMRDVSKSLGVGVSMEIEGGIRPSILPGLNEMCVQFQFSGIARRGSLVSLLVFLDSHQAKVPFLVEEMDQQKDTLRLKILLLGV